MIDPSHLAVLETALAQSPDNTTLRLHLAGLYLQASDAPAALTHVQRVLEREPDHAEGLGLAARAAEAAGQFELQQRYQRLATALGVAAAPATPALSTTDAGKATTDAADTARVVPQPDGAHDDIEGESRLWVTVGEDGEMIAELDISTVRLDDVGGLDAVKRRLRTSFLTPLRNPELRELYRKSLRGGLLLYGPPGCGKTFIARAVAGEMQARFFAVGLHEVLDKWLGASERQVHATFATARRAAPCVLFLDELDAIGHKRSNLSGSSGLRTVVVQLLSEMDGLDSQNEGLFVIGATNQPWDIDPALRRPGRFDRMVLVLPPDEPARRAILAYHLRDRPVAPNVDLSRLAHRTDLFSGADLRLVCESAAEMALEDAIETGRARLIEMKDLERAVRDIEPSTRAWFQNARSFAQFANEGGRYDDLLEYIRRKRL